MAHIENELLPRALMMGVDYDFFWTLNPKSLSPFIKAFSFKQQYDDMVSWQNGLYIRLAIASVMDKNTKYPEKPLSSKTKVVDKKVDKRKKMLEIKEMMLARMGVLNQKFKDSGGSE